MSAGDWKNMLDGAQKGDLSLVRYHLEAGVNPNYQHPEFLTTPLIESIAAQHVEIVDYLLSQGADPQLKAGFSEDTPLIVAKRTKNRIIINLVKQQLPKEKKHVRFFKNMIYKCLQSILKRYNI